jgi:uncharacterized protein YecE (DUF72 family)
MAFQPSWHIGLVGFSYPEWESTLYRGVPKSTHRLAHYVTLFNAVEINTTFYGVPTAKTVRTWRDATPDGFRFCVKMPRDVTHGPTPSGALAASEPPRGHLALARKLDAAKRLVDGMQPLGAKLGAVLMQFPPRFAAERADELAAFLAGFGRAAPLAVELRHASWATPETATLLREHGVCWVAADESVRKDVETSPAPADERTLGPTADFLYVRWLGKHGQFPDRSRERFDPTPRLRWWADRIDQTTREHADVRAVYGFFDNDFAGHAPASARRFLGVLGPPTPGAFGSPPAGRTLFG